MPVYVTDTHPLVWYVANYHRKLSRIALRLFDEAVHERALIYVPAVTLWEIAGLLKAGRVQLREPFGQWVASLLALRGFELAPLDVPVITESLNLNLALFDDPFDAAIVATARLSDLPLITKDKRIADTKIVEVAR